MIKVAIWGSYGYGNYGDDLMAIQFARCLKTLGTHPVVFRLDSALATAYGIETTPSVVELLRGASFAVFGGGPVLSDGPHGRGRLVEAYREKKKEYEDFRAALVGFRCPLYLLSVGSNFSAGSQNRPAPFREAVLTSGLCRLATVRIEDDIEAFYNGYGIRSRHFPDVNLNAGSIWSPTAKGRHKWAKAHVGLNLPHLYCRIVPVLRLTALICRIQYTFIQTIRPAAGREVLMSEVLPERSSPLIGKHIYKDPADVLSIIASMDMVVSHKLHLGVSALAIGVPFLSIAKSAKNHAFFESINASEASWANCPERNKKLALLRLITYRKRIRQFANNFNFEEVERQRELSRGHLECLRVIVASHAG